MKHTLHLLFILLFPLCVAYTQVSIGHNNPEASAALDVSAVAEDGVTVLPKGFLIPRMTTAERDAIVNPATGLIIYNSITNCTEYFQGQGKGWHNFCEKSGDGGYSSNGSAIVNGYDCQNGVPAAETGRMIADTKLLDSVSHTIIATVGSGGTYSLSAAVNGVVFAAKGTFTEPDPADPTTKEQKVKLIATGTPINKGIYTFNLNSVPDCSFNREVYDATSGGTSIVGFWDCPGTGVGTLTAGRTIGSETPAVVVTQTISAIVDKIGTYSVETPTSNGVVFKAEGNFDALGLTEVILIASGIPLEIDAATKFDLPLKTPCSFTREVLINSTSNGTAEVSTYVATTTTKGKLQFQKQIVDGEVSHTITATVVNPGKYTIETDTQNGATFKGSGVFTAAGEQSVELFASGKPEVVGDFEYTTDTTPPNCVIKRPTVGNDSSGGDAVISYFICSTNGAGPGQGVMMKGVEIQEGEVTQIIKVNVTKAGTYDISTNTVNDVMFRGKGTFAATGNLQTVILTASGTPTESTVDPKGVAFTIDTKPNCAFNRVILDKNSSGGTSTITAYDCTGANTGDIIVSKRIDPATANITKTIKVTVGAEGTYYIRATKHGVVFSAQGTFVAADVTGAPIDVILKADGMGDTIIADASFAIDVVGSDPAVPLGCSFEREILLNPSSNGSADVATYICIGDGTGGTGKIIAGAGIIDETDTTSDKYVTQTVIADVNEIGTYNISITNDKLTAPNDVDTKIIFEASGTFTKKGKQPLVLKAKPSVSGQPPFYDLGKDANSDQPSFTIKPVATSGPEYTYCTFRRLILNSTSGGSSRVGKFDCGGLSTPFGTLINGMAIPVAPPADVVEHRVSADVEVPGSYNLKTIKNGVIFRASGTFTSTGKTEVVFVATGIPTAPVVTSAPYNTNITFKIHPFLPATAGCATCSPPIPARPTESDPDETVDLQCEFDRVIAEPAVITTDPSVPEKFCTGIGTRTMTVNARGGATLKFQWQKDGVDVVEGGVISVLSGAYTSTITFTNPTPTDTGNYTCVVSNGSTATSQPAKLTVNPLPTITSSPAPADTKKCETGSFALRATSSDSAAGSEYKIQWYEVIGNVDTYYSTVNSGDALTTRSISAGSPQVVYKAEALNFTTGCVSAAKTPVTVQAYNKPSNPSNTDESICGPSSLTITLKPGTDPDISGKWYLDSTTTTPRPEGGTVTFATTGAQTVYLSAFHTTSGCESNRISITVTANAVPTGVTLNTTTTLKSCGESTFDLKATAVGGGASTKVRWYINGSVESPDINSGATYTTPTLTEATTGSKDYVYSVDAYDTQTRCASNVIKPTVTISIHKLPTISVAAPQSFCHRKTVKVSATAANGDRVYWYPGTVGTPEDFYTTSGADKDLTSLNLPVGIKTYYLSAYNTTTLCPSTTRVPLAITINGSPDAPTPTKDLYARCGDGDITLEVNASGTKEALWYDTAAGTTPINTAASLTLPVTLSATKIYYVEFRDPDTGCISYPLNARKAITAVKSTEPATPTVTNSARCGSGSVELIASTSTPGATINWYDVDTGGGALLTNNVKYTTPSASTATKSYYAEAVLVESGGVSGGCSSKLRKEAIATIHNQPDPPVFLTQSPNYICGSGTATVSVATVPGVSMYWYESDGVTEVTPIQARDSYTTTTLNASKTYMVEARVPNCASSTKTSVVVKHSTRPVLPIAEAQSPATVCSKVAGDAITLKVTHVDGIDMHWFDGASEITPVGPRDTYTTPLISASKAYSVEARDTTTGCKSSGKTTVTATIGDTPATPIPVAQSPLIVCKGFDKATVGVTHVDGVGMYWYEGTNEVLPSGARDTYQTDILTGNKTFTVEARNIATGCASVSKATVIATATDTPVVPVVSTQSPNYLCGSGTVTVSVATVSGVSMYWYESDGITEVTPIQARDSYTIASLNSSKTFMVEARSGTCKSNKTSVTVKYSTKPNLPVAEAQSPATVCSTVAGDAITLKVTHVDGIDMHWFDGASEITPVAPRDSYTTPRISTSKTYSVEARDTTTGCISSGKASVTANISPLPYTPVSTTIQSPNYICGTGRATISVLTVNGVDMHWYDGASEVVPPGARDSYQTPELSAAKTYTVEAIDRTTGCKSASKASIDVKHGNFPDLPVVLAQSPQYACYTSAGSDVTLSVTPVAGVGMYWFDGAAEVSPSAARDSYVVRNLQTSKVYTVEARNTTTGCISTSKANVPATITSLPATPVSTATQSPDYICGTGTATVSVVHVDGIDMFWYDGVSPILPSVAQDSFTTPTLSSGKTYTVEARDPITLCKSASKGSVVVKQSAAPTIPNVVAQSPQYACESTAGTSVTLGVLPVNGIAFHWFDGTTEIVPIAARDTYSTPLLTTTKVYSVEARSLTTSCISAKVTATATISTLPATPLEAAQSPKYICDTGSAKLNVTPVTGVDMFWYRGDGSPAAAAASNFFDTPSLSSSTTYYVEAKNATTGCKSATRATVTANQTARPTISFTESWIVCAGNAVAIPFTVSSGVTQIRKYTTNTNTLTGTITTIPYSRDYIPVNTQSDDWRSYNPTTECESTSRNLVVTYSVRPLLPVAVPQSDQYVCAGVEDVTIGVAAVTGVDMHWYTNADVELAGNPSNTYKTPVLSVSTSYKVQAQKADGCTSSSKLTVTANVTALPNAPTVTSSFKCGTGIVAISAAQTNCYIDWYDTLTSTTAFRTADTYSPDLTSTTAYYVSARDKTSGCVSSSRSTVTASIKPIPNISATSVLVETKCLGKAFNWGATTTTPNGIVNWYLTPTGVSQSTNNTWSVIPSAVGDTSYYAKTLLDGCESNALTFTATAAPAPAAPTLGVAGGACSPSGDATVSATNATDCTIDWYDSATGITMLKQSSNSLTQPITANTIFYAESRNLSGCTSITRLAVSATLYALPLAPVEAAQSPQYVCSGVNNATVSVTPVTGVDMYWYNSSDVEIVGNPRNSYFVSAPTATTTFKVRAKSDKGCFSTNLTTVTATVSPLPDTPIESTQTPNYICATGTATVSVTAVTGIGMYWYDGATEILPSAARNSYTTPSLSASKTYSVEARNTTTGCKSTLKGSVVVKHGTLPATPAAVAQSPQYVCASGGTVTLGVTPVAGVGMYWYDGTTEILPSAARDSYTTPSLTATKTYSVEARNTTTGCVSLVKGSVTATISPLPDTPVESTQTPNYICATGTATVSVTAVAGIGMFWYDGATEILPSAARNSYTTPSLSASKTYSVEARNTTTGCKSAVKGSVVVKHSTLPATPAAVAQSPQYVCASGGTVTLGVTAVTGVGMYWYDGTTEILPSAARNTYTTPSLTATKTYSVEARNTTTGCVSSVKGSVTATISPLPDTPVESTQTPNYICATGTATVSVTAVAGIGMYWYDGATEILPSAARNSYTTPSLSASKTYSVEARNTTTGCKSAVKGSVVVKHSTLPATPAAVAQSPQYVCASGGTVTLGVTAVTGVGMYWYDGTTEILPSAARNSYTTPSLTATKTYSVEARNTTTGCVSLAKGSVTATISPLPNTPVESTQTPNYICATGTATVSVTAVTGIGMFWYDGATEILPSAARNSYTTPSLSASKTYSVEARNTTTGCKSAVKGSVVVKHSTLPATPAAVAQSPQYVCASGGTVTLGVTAVTGVGMYWYDGTTEILPSAARNSYTTPSLTATKTYSVEARNTTTGCISSAKASVTATISPLPTVSFTNQAAVCANTTISVPFTITDGNQIRWYVVPGGTAPVGTDTADAGTGIFTWTHPNTPQEWDAEAYNSTTGCFASTKKRFTVIAKTAPAAPTATTAVAFTKCLGDTFYFGATSVASAAIEWYLTSSGGLRQGSGYTFNPKPSTVGATKYYAEAKIDGCASDRIEFTATTTANQLPAAPVAVAQSPQYVCSGYGTATLGVTPVANVEMYWYDSSNVEVAGPSNTYTTPALSANTVYTVQARSTNGCTNTTSVTATVTASPAIVSTTATSVTACKNVEVFLGVTAATGTDRFRVYDGVQDGIPLGLKAEVLIGNLFGISRDFSDLYSVLAHNSVTGCDSRPGVKITVYRNTCR